MRQQVGHFITFSSFIFKQIHIWYGINFVIIFTNSGLMYAKLTRVIFFSLIYYLWVCEVTIMLGNRPYAWRKTIGKHPKNINCPVIVFITKSDPPSENQYFSTFQIRQRDSNGIRNIEKYSIFKGGNSHF